MPMVIAGQYFPGKADPTKLRNKRSSTWKQHDHKRQRQDNASEIVQPYTREGKPSEAFIDNYPDESIDYGFVKGEEEVIGIDSGTGPVDQGAQEFYSNDDLIRAEIPEEDYHGED